MAGNEEKTPEREQWARASNEHRTDFERAKSPVPQRVAAVAMWVLAAAAQIAGVLVVMGAVQPPALADLWFAWALATVLCCLALTVAGQVFWKKAGATAQVKSQSEVAAFFATLGFVPWAVFFLAAKNATSRAKVLAVVAAAIVFAVVAVLNGVLPMGE